MNTKLKYHEFEVGKLYRGTGVLYSRNLRGITNGEIIEEGIDYHKTPFIFLGFKRNLYSNSFYCGIVIKNKVGRILMHKDELFEELA